MTLTQCTIALITKQGRKLGLLLLFIFRFVSCKAATSFTSVNSKHWVISWQSRLRDIITVRIHSLGPREGLIRFLWCWGIYRLYELNVPLDAACFLSLFILWSQLLLHVLSSGKSEWLPGLKLWRVITIIKCWSNWSCLHYFLVTLVFLSSCVIRVPH